MNEVVTVEIPIDPAAAPALKDTASRERIGRLISRIAWLYQGEDPLADVFARTSRAAAASGLTDSEIEAELAAYKAERRI
jgi:hypothetical protein